MKPNIYISVTAACIAIFLSSCSFTKYSVSLCKVESPVYAKQQYGETKIVNFNDDNLTKYTYEDEFIMITWYTERDRFNFILRNKSDHTLKIPWDEMAFVDINGVAGRVMHSGVKYIDRDISHPASVVPKESSVKDVVVPTDNIYNDTGKDGRWSIKALLPQYNSQEELDASGVIGGKMKILFPVIIENVTNEYIFIFRIDNATINKLSYGA